MAQVATSFRLPIGNGFLTETSSDGAGWYDANDFAEYYDHNTSTSYHLGEDWNRNDGNDFGKPVYAAANGRVVFSDWGGTAWGNVIIIQHTRADGSVVSTLYGHLNTIDVSISDVTIGQQIGTLGSANSTPGVDNGIYPAHLHFGVYLGAISSVPLGYSATADDPYANGWVDPSWFINRFGDAGDTLGTAKTITDLNSTISGHVGLTTTTWLSGQHVNDTDTNDFLKFVTPTNGNLTLTLSNLTADVDLRLLDANGTQIAASTRAGTASEDITDVSLVVNHTYYIQIDPYLSAASEYSLTVDYTPPTDPQSMLPVAAGGIATISHSFLWSFDNVSGPDNVTYTVLNSPTHGTIFLNGTATATFTQADIDNGLVQYRNNGNSPSSDGFDFTVSDEAGNKLVEPFKIAVVNTTAPVVETNVTLAACVGTALPLFNSFLDTVALGNEPTDLRYTVLTGPVHGILLVDGAPTVSFTQADVDEGLVRYIANGDAATNDGFTFQATDAAGDQTPITTFNVAISDGVQGLGTCGQASALGSTAPLFDFSDIIFDANTTLDYSMSGDNNGGALTVSDGMHNANLALLGQYAAAGFATAPDRGGGTVVTYAAAQGGDPSLLTIPQH